jgi:hypothetical protein
MLTEYDRIYKPKYMDEPAANKTPEKPAPPVRSFTHGEGRRVDASELMESTTNPKPAGRARSRSLWGRKKA